MSYSMLSTCTFIQTMLKWTPVQRERERERERVGGEGKDRQRERETSKQTERDAETMRGAATVLR